jgi:hypothetical protein
MISSIGIRASASEIYYSVLQSDNSVDLISKDIVRVPIALEIPERLNYVRKVFKDIIFEYKINRAGIRLTESIAQTPSIDRIYYEAIIQEVLASSSIEKYFAGQIAKISHKLQILKDDFKPIVAGDIKYDFFTDQIVLSKNKATAIIERESILTGLAALTL